ncbi:hypothetical protein ABTM13_19840, partial [Acinetobacter baumannii]
ANNEYRQMQAWAVGIMATPVLATTVSPTALVTSLKLKFELNISGALADATVQLATRNIKDFNLTSTVMSGALGAPSSLLSLLGAGF